MPAAPPGNCPRTARSWGWPGSPCKPDAVEKHRERAARGTTMFHPSTERLIDYWRSKSVNGGVPARAAINPGDFPDLLPQVLILGRDAKGRYPVRLAGGF